MKKALLGLLPLAALAALAVAGSALLPQSASSNSPIGSKILAHKLAVELGTETGAGQGDARFVGHHVHALRRGRHSPAAGLPRTRARCMPCGGREPRHLEPEHRGLPERVPRARA